MRDLAYLSMARTYYSASRAARRQQRSRPSTPTSSPPRSSTGTGSTSRASTGSTRSSRSRWAYFMAGDYPHALGNIHTIESPYFPNSFYPEADILRAVISFTICQYEDATTIVARMKKKYEPIKKELEAVAQPVQGRGGRAAVLRASSRTCAPARPTSRPSSGRSSRTRSPIASSSATSSTCASSTRRTARFKKAPASFRNSPIGNDVTDALNLARDLAIRNAGALAARALPAQPRRAERAPPRRVEDPHRHHLGRAQQARPAGGQRAALARRSRSPTASSSPTTSTCSGRSTASTGATSSASTGRSWSRSAPRSESGLTGVATGRPRRTVPDSAGDDGPGTRHQILGDEGRSMESKRSNGGVLRALQVGRGGRGARRRRGASAARLGRRTSASRRRRRRRSRRARAASSSSRSTRSRRCSFKSRPHRDQPEEGRAAD